jgi:hypothetical protein
MMRSIHRLYGLGIVCLLGTFVVWHLVDDLISENPELIFYNQRTSDGSSRLSSNSSVLCCRIGADDDQAFLRAWEKMKESIISVSLLKTDWSHDLRSNPSFQQWVRECMSYFTYPRLQRTGVSRPLDEYKIMRKIHSIVEENVKNPGTAAPLRIVVFGGSVTAGHQCLANIFDFKVKKTGRDDTNTAVHLCAWPSRLQDIFDEILGKDVVTILNMAVGGASTDLSTTVMQFGMIPGSTPDIIVWDHGSNDAAEYLNATQIFGQKLQSFYQATLELPKSCSQIDPPIVILLDTLLGDQAKFPLIHQSMTASAAFWQMIAWYPNVWGISYANTVRPYILSNLESNQNMLHLLGSKGLFVHPGMMYHITVAWVIAFNILHALHDHCLSRNYETIISLEETEFEFSTPNILHHLPSEFIPELSDELELLQVRSQWNKRLTGKNKNQTCLVNQMPFATGDEVFTTHSTLKCHYAWMVNRVAKVTTREHVNQALKPYLIGAKGWEASGFPIKKPRTGWFAKGRGSWFELAFDGIPSSVKNLHIIYMKSYSEDWYNATVSIDCSISAQAEVNSIGAIPSISTAESLLHYLSGYHVAETSILVPATLPLPLHNISTERVKLTLKFKLIEGETFKITGIGLC